MTFKLDNTLKTLVEHDLTNDLIPMLLGEPGIGKSSWIEALAKDLKTKSFTLACNQLADKSDLTGARLMPYTVTKNGNTTTDYTQQFFPHIVITNAINYAEKHPQETPILFLDELNRTTSDVTSEALSIPTMRSIGNRPLPENLKVITAGNDKGNVVSLDSASVSRFVLYPVEPDVNTFIALDSTLNSAIKTVLIKHPDYLFMQEPLDVVSDTSDDDNDDDLQTRMLYDSIENDNQLSQLTTPRTIMGLSRWLNSYKNSDDLAALAATTYTDAQGKSQSVLLDAIESHTGKTAFSIAVCDQINEQLTQPSTNNTTITKPKNFDILQKAATINELDELLTKMSTNEIEANFVYALYDQNNNSVVIDEIVKLLDSKNIALSKETNRTLILLGSNSQLNPVNVNYLIGLDEPLAKSLAVLGSIN